jgi:hypothetical protein
MKFIARVTATGKTKDQEPLYEIEEFPKTVSNKNTLTRAEIQAHITYNEEEITIQTLTRTRLIRSRPEPDDTEQAEIERLQTLVDSLAEQNEKCSEMLTEIDNLQGR